MTRHGDTLRGLAALLLAAASVSTPAVTPLSPSLDAPTHARLIRGLDEARVPGVGHNSVVIAIVSALGSEPRDADVAYDEPHRHLPKVRAQARVRSDGCASVGASVGGAADAGYADVRVTGTFCRVGPARWSSADVAVRPSAAP